jgi:hypothetical protein
MLNAEKEMQMSDERQLLLVTNPTRFMELIHTEDPEARRAGLESFEDLVLCEIIRYGLYNREGMIAPLAKLYRELVASEPEERRFGLYRHVAGFVQNTSVVSTNALLPFIAEEISFRIVSTAVIDYVSLGPVTDRDPMSRVNDIIGMIESGMLKNEGAAFGGLLSLGDKRVCKLLTAIRDSLDRDAINEAVKCGTGFISAATVDFYLDWLEGMEGDLEDPKFGIVISGLMLLKKESRTDQVTIGERPFPTRGVTNEQWAAMRKPIPLSEYLKHVAPRMYALERTEPPPKIMPYVLAEWGLQPLGDPLDTASLEDDRWRTSVGYRC